MPRFVTTIFLAFFCFISCAQKTGFLLEKSGLKHLQSKLSYIPEKSFAILDYAGKDSLSFYKERITSVRGFYISRTEVTNKEYREFINYARDSIGHTLLAHFQAGTRNIDWSKTIDWNDEQLEAMMLSPEERIFGKKEIDTRKILYAINFFGKEESISIYPDTLVWIREFSNSYNELFAKKYFSGIAYDQYPVVGISLKQAMAFCRWKTDQYNKLLNDKEAAHFEMVVGLPTNAEWESAAVEVKDVVTIFDGNKGYSCNFGIITTGQGLTKKGYKDDGYFYTAPVRSFPAGPFGLYDMKGNVAEWTSTAREEIMNAEVKADKLKTSFVVKGGGWNSTPFYLQAGVCHFFSADDTHSFVGFRYVVYPVQKK